MLLLPLDGMLIHHRVPSMNQLGVLPLLLDGMLVQNFPNNLLLIGLKKGKENTLDTLGTTFKCPETTYGSICMWLGS